MKKTFIWVTLCSGVIAIAAVVMVASFAIGVRAGYSIAAEQCITSLYLDENIDIGPPSDDEGILLPNDDAPIIQF